tara:strand:+ start:162 stop:293 length:132 start_codon:yes stop_codon:yes gene_type:complete
VCWVTIDEESIMVYKIELDRCPIISYNKHMKDKNKKGGKKYGY